MGENLFTTEEQEFIRTNYQGMPLREIARKVKRTDRTVSDWAKENGLVKTKSHHRDHPFKKANRRLEAVIINRKQENRIHNPK